MNEEVEPPEAKAAATPKSKKARAPKARRPKHAPAEVDASAILDGEEGESATSEATSEASPVSSETTEQSAQDVGSKPSESSKAAVAQSEPEEEATEHSESKSAEGGESSEPKSAEGGERSKSKSSKRKKEGAKKEKAEADTGDKTTEADKAEAEPMDEKARRRAELESFLGPKVKAPVEIPLSYIPNDRSIHPIFHIEVSHLDYAGPLDLLLYLIRRHDLDVMDIPVAFVTEKYLSMLEALEALEIDLAAEFLVLAAELAHIKSKMLLPAEKGVPVEETTEEEIEGDPRAELVRRLLEYQKYRDAAEQLSERDQLGRDVFPRVPPAMEKAEDVDPGLKQVSVFRLVELMSKLLKDVPVHHEISYEHFSIRERIQYVASFGEEAGGRFTVVSLMTDIASKQELVVTFIALLEMAKMGLARILVDVFHERRDPIQKFSPAPKSPPAPDTSEGGAQEHSPTDEAALSGELAESEGADLTEDQPRLAAQEEGLDTDPLDEDAPVVDTAPDAPDATSEASTKSAAATASMEGRAEDVSAMQQEVEALTALAEEAAQSQPVDTDAVDLPTKSAQDMTSEPNTELEPLPEIWVELTDRKFQGDLVDDYR